MTRKRPKTAAVPRQSFDEYWSSPVIGANKRVWLLELESGGYLDVFKDGPNGTPFVVVKTKSEASIFEDQALAADFLEAAGAHGRGVRVVGPVEVTAADAAERELRQSGVSIEAMPADVMDVLTALRDVLASMVQPASPIPVWIMLEHAYTLGTQKKVALIKKKILPRLQSITATDRERFNEAFVRAGLELLIGHIGRELLRRALSFEKLRIHQPRSAREVIAAQLRYPGITCEPIAVRLMARRRADIDELLKLSRAHFVEPLDWSHVLTVAVAAGLRLLLDQPADKRPIDLTFPTSVSLEDAGDVILGLGIAPLSRRLSEGETLH